MEEDVALEKVVEAAITRNLELWSDSESSTCSFCALDGLYYAVFVACEVHRPLVERACR